MDTKVLIQSFTEFAKQKNVDRPTMIRILQDVFRAMIKKKYQEDENFDIVINAEINQIESKDINGISKEIILVDTSPPPPRKNKPHSTNGPM